MRTSPNWKRFVVIVCTLSLLTLGTALAKPERITSVEGITQYKLDNGMQVLLFPDSSKPTITANVTYFVGSRHEGRGEKGMAHLLEHMVFKGTPDNPELWKSLEDHGARFNGTTWVDRTNYYETLPSEPGNLEWVIAMEADRMLNCTISADDLATEFSVVRNEFEMGENDPTGVLWERMVSTAYTWHNYGDSTIGSKSDIERVPAANLKAFYAKYYQPDNAMLVLAGDFDPEKALQLIDASFGAIPRPERELKATYTVEPIQDGARRVELKRVGDVAAVGTVYHIPPGSHEDYAAIDVIAQILADEPSGRLYKELVETGLASGIFGVAFGWREPGVIVNMAQVAPDQSPDPTMDKMIETIEGLATRQITDEEVKRAKRSLLKSIEISMKDSRRVGIELSEWAAAGDWRLIYLHRDRIEGVTTAQVRQAAETYFKESNRTSGIFYPQVVDQIRRAEIPSAPDVAALLEGYTGGEALAEGEDFEATPENIESRLTRSELDNGMRLALLPKETRGDSVNAMITLRYGSEKTIQGRRTAVNMIPEMLMRGTDKHTYQQIQDRLDELKATVNMSAGGGMSGFDNSMDVAIRTDRENLPAVIELVFEIVSRPAFPESEFEIIKNERMSSLEESLSDPQQRAFRYMLRELNPASKDDVRYIPTIEESIERLNAVSVKDLASFQKKFYGASHAQMTVIGDFDSAVVEQTIAKTFGSWDSPDAFERIEYRFAGEIKPRSHKINTPDKKMAMVACGTNVNMRDDDAQYPAMHLTNYVLGASAKSRLLERLRQKEGVSYGAGSFFLIDSQDRDALFAGMAIAAPENALKARDSLFDEFKRLVEEGIPESELEDAKASYALQVKTQLSSDSTVAGMINSGLYLDRTMEFYADLYEAISGLTTDQIKQALEENVDLGHMIQVQAGDLQEKSEG